MPIPVTSRPRAAWTTVATLVLGGVLAGCGSGAADLDAAPTPPTVAPSTPADSPSAPAPGASASTASSAVPGVLRFSGKTVSGATFRGSSLAGRPVVLWFWAPWCAVCRSQAPKVSALTAKYGDDLAVVGIGSLDSAGAIAGFADQVNGPVHLSDPKGSLWKRFRIAEQSSFVVLDADGTEVLRTGYNDDGDLAKTVARVVG